MDVSIIIVNYNVKYFLDQCLRSVFASTGDLEYEVYVVDNNSKDDSVNMVKSSYPDVHLIQNDNNVGFAAANNQALAISKGRYKLLLNPDTIIQRDTLFTCVQYMDKHPKAGALGVRMIDGSGAYLPESKRGVPTPFAAFSKMTGLYKLFSTSAKWNRYYMGTVGETDVANIEVLSGAFMFMRSSVLADVGFLDDTFFMYGEDIDLSYRINQAGHDIIYYGEASIVHFKGESTRKSSLTYHRHFHKAMVIFWQKHFAGNQTALGRMFIQSAIYSKGLLSYLMAIGKRFVWPLVVVLIIIASYVAAKNLWSIYYHDDIDYLPVSFYSVNLPIYIGSILLSMLFHGQLINRTGWLQTGKAALTSLIILLGIYALLPLEYRSSRAVLLLGWALTMFVIFCLDLIVASRKTKGRIKTLFVGSQPGFQSFKQQTMTGNTYEVLGYVSRENSNDEAWLGQLGDMEDICRAFQPHKLIYERKLFTMDELIDNLTRFGKHYEVSMLTEASDVVIGSSSKKRPGDINTLAIAYKLQDPAQRNSKRMLDLLLVPVSILAIPISLIVHKSSGKFIKNILDVLLGKATWVGYIPFDKKLDSLPTIRPGITAHSPIKSVDASEVHQLNFLYARDYSPLNDLTAFFRLFKTLDS